MESLHIESELVEESPGNTNSFGNMTVFNNGRTVFNRKAKGIYFTLSLTIFTTALMAFLV